MLLGKQMSRVADRYVKNRDGNIAVITALVGIPLLLVAGYAIDYNSAYRYKGNIEAALDTATLASVVPANLDEAERQKFAQDIFNKNYFGDLPVELDIQAFPDRVDIAAVGKVPTLFGSIVGHDTISVRETSAAVLTTSDVVCALALDPAGDRAIEFLDDAQFSSPECSVQANSTSSRAMVSSSSYVPSAKSFCVAGVSTGRYAPYVKHACTPIADPYASLPEPTERFCHNLDAILRINERIQMAGVAEDIIGNNTVLPPGEYCNGLRLAGLNIIFMPGTYFIHGGNFHMESFASATGDGVTFILKGGESNLIVETGAQASFKAPDRGDYAGLVFYQTPSNAPTSSYPEGQSIIGSGGGLNITGTAYFPTQELIITSDSPVASQAPATSFIAYRMKFAGSSYTEIHVDHEAGGIPPLLPRSDEGARLVSYADRTPDEDDQTD